MSPSARPGSPSARSSGDRRVSPLGGRLLPVGVPGWWPWSVPVLLLFAVQWAWTPVVLQPSGSVERGLWAGGFGPVGRGDLVLVRTPASVRSLLSRHGQSGRAWLLKPVVAVSGQTVRCGEAGLWIDGVHRATTLRFTSQGERMPVLRFDRELVAGEAWLLAEGAPTSVDSRCFGPVDLDEARGPYRLWWSWDR